MKRHQHFLLLVACPCLVAGVFAGSVADARGNVAVGLTAPKYIAAGLTFIASVNIKNASDLCAANYDINFDPKVLEVTNVSNGLIAGTAIPVDIWREITPGTIRLINTLPALSGASGSGYLAKIEFHVIGSAGSMSYIKLSNGVLSNTSANEIPVTWSQTLVCVSR